MATKKGLFFEEAYMSDRLLRLEAVIDLVGFKSSKIYALIAQGKFPRPIKIDSASRWRESAIQHWIDQREAASEADAA